MEFGVTGESSYRMIGEWSGGRGLILEIDNKTLSDD